MATSDLSLKGALVQSGLPASDADVIVTAIQNPVAVGALNNQTLGLTTPAAVKTSDLQASYTDSSGTPGNATNNSPRGRVAFAAGAATVVVTNSLVTAASTILVTLRSVDDALTHILTVLPTAGAFTITANAVSTGTAAKADFLVVN